MLFFAGVFFLHCFFFQKFTLIKHAEIFCFERAGFFQTAIRQLVEKRSINV